MKSPIIRTDHDYEYPLYSAVSLYLSDRFKREHGIITNPEKYFVDETWRYNSGEPLGPFSRPDFVSVTLHALRYLNSPSLELHAFQVKRYQSDVRHAITGALEAAYYKRWAHYSYLVMHYPFEERETGAFYDVVNECFRGRIGFIIFDDADHIDSFHMYLRPEFDMPYPPLTERFIANRITEGGRSQIDGWHAA